MRWLWVCCAALFFWGCGDDGGSNTSDTAQDTAEEETAEDTMEEVEDTAEDTGPIFGTISGNIFWNLGEVPDGSLTIALVTSRTPTSLDPDLTQVVDPATLPASFTFDSVPGRTEFYLLAFFDVGRDNTLDSPGLEDYLSISEGAAGIDSNGEVVSNINVELR